MQGLLPGKLDAAVRAEIVAKGGEIPLAYIAANERILGTMVIDVGERALQQLSMEDQGIDRNRPAQGHA
jgi:hypothetical protein